MNSEKRYGIVEQPKDTCPLLDNMLGKMLKAQSKIEEALKGDDLSLEDMRNLLIGLHSALIEDGGITVEEIRERVIEIRAWGQAWKEEALSRSVK
nr:MAG TPA: hypothetical protein [Caudoviricetes sp.]